MSVAFIVDLPGAGPADYDWVVEHLELGGRMPPGGLFHAAGPYAGGWRVVDVWETADQFERFARERSGPLVAQRLGMAPQVARIDVFAQAGVAGASPAVVQLVRLPTLTPEGFRERDARVRPDRTPPDGCLFHADGTMDGGYAVTDAWSADEARRRFLRERALPVMGDLEHALEVMEVARTLPPAAAVVA